MARVCNPSLGTYSNIDLSIRLGGANQVYYFVRLGQDMCNSSALAMGLSHFCINPSIYSHSGSRNIQLLQNVCKCSGGYMTLREGLDINFKKFKLFYRMAFFSKILIYCGRMSPLWRDRLVLTRGRAWDRALTSNLFTVGLKITC